MKQKSRNRILLPLASVALSMGAGSAGASPTHLNQPNPSIDILGISFHQQSGLVTLRWTSQPDSSYIIEETTDLGKTWIRNLAGIEGNDTETSYTILPIQDQGRSRAMFFRVLEMPKESLESTDIDSADENSSQIQSALADSPLSSAKVRDQEGTLKPSLSSPAQAGTQTQQAFTHSQPNFAVT